MHSKIGMKKLQWSFFYNPYEVKTNKSLELLKKDFMQKTSAKNIWGLIASYLFLAIEKQPKGCFS